jgi:polysaccharide deacetylase family protein (PEP-CTERM system associated)
MASWNTSLPSREIPRHKAIAYPFGATPDVFTIDIEDWFHILELTSTPDIGEWDRLESRVERNLTILLDLLAVCNIKATCFALGWIADRFPILLRNAAEAGHEIASHGYRHQTVTALTPSQFRDDVRKSKIAIENATGFPVRGYRAPGFSITESTSWAFQEMLEAGFLFDSSVFPALHGHGGIPDAPRRPHLIETPAGSIAEFPISVADTLFGRQCFFGGGYLRLYPLWLIQLMAKRVRADGEGVVWYIHPREIDPGHPRIPMSLSRHFKSYINLSSTGPKLKSILSSGRFATLGELALQFSQVQA